MARINSSLSNSKREVIIRAAAILFKEKGYKATSMRELASKVGVEAASLYNHISGKDQLLKEICLNVSNKYHSHIDELGKLAGAGTGKVEKVIRFHVKEMIDNYEFVFVTDQNWRQLKEPGLSQCRDLRRSYRKKFTSIVQQGIDDHEINAMDPNSVVMIILNAISAVDQWHRIIHKTDSIELENTIVSVLINGIKMPVKR